MDRLLNLEHQLVGDIYDAAISPSLWGKVISNLVALADAEKGNLLAYDRLNPDYFIFHSHGISPEQLQFYQEGGFATLDQEFSGRFMAGYEGRALANHRHFGSIERFKAEAGRLYTEFFSRVGILYQAGGLMEMTDFRWSVVGLHRGEDNRPFDDAVVEMLTRLMPHLRRALQIHRQLSSLQQQNIHLYRALDNLVTGVMLLDGQHKVRYANGRAEQLLKNNDALQVTAHHTLQAKQAAANADIQRMLQNTVTTSRRENDSSDIGGVVSLMQESGQRRLLLTVTPLSSLAGYRELTTDGIATALFISAPDDGHTVSRTLLKNAYALTERECDVCQAFLNQACLEAMAETCGLSLASVRTYLKLIYEKTGQHSQAELMRLLMGHTLDFRHMA